MKIHHFTIPARDPAHVAHVLAELLGARVTRLPHPAENHLVWAENSDGTAIEVWPAGTRGDVGEAHLSITDMPLPKAWPHHAYVTHDECSAEQILAVFSREGWHAEKIHNGPPGFGFSLVRGWIENQIPIELGGRDMRHEYERFVQQAMGGTP